MNHILLATQSGMQNLPTKHFIFFLAYLLTLKAQNKNCSRQHFNVLLLSFEQNKAWFLGRGFTWNIKSYFLWKTMK